MTALKKALDDFANGYEMVTGDMLPKDLRATVKRALLAGVLGYEYDRKIWRVHYSRMETVPGS